MNKTIIGHHWGIIMFGVAALVASASLAFGNDLPSKGTWSFGMQSAYSVSADSGSRKIDRVPVHLRIGYTAFKGSTWFLPSGSLEIATEPFGSIVTRKIQAGFNFYNLEGINRNLLRG